MTKALFLYPTHPVRCIITGPSECGKSTFLTSLFSNIFNEIDKVFIYSPGLHQVLCQELIKCCSNYITIHIISNVLNEEDRGLVTDEINNNNDFQKSDTKNKDNWSIEDLKFPRIWWWGIISLDNLSEKKWRVLGYNQCSKDQGRKIYPFMLSIKIILKCLKLKELCELKEKTTILSNQTVIVIYKIFIKIIRRSICLLKNSTY